MINTKSRTKSSIPAYLQQQVSDTLEPIYSKANLLKRELQMLNNQKKQAQTMTNFFTKTWKQQFLTMDVDRDLEIEKERKFHQSQTITLKNEKERKSEPPKTSANWRDHKRNNAKSLINFLVNNKTVKRTRSKSTLKNDQLKPQQKVEDLNQNERFEPVGEQYKKEKLYQESLRSQTQSLSGSRNDQSSLRSSTVLASRKQNSSKKYLRKGTRVRQILMRQLQTPDQRGSSASSLTYLKDYDQWVPSALVQEKKAELEIFMNIIYGEKKSSKVQAVNLDKIQLIYL